ncbi:MAG: putative alkylated repair protein [Sphingomonas bacterium]|uniref:alpha-ketoglutarate-dependent dioxygenase AlkB family protein n=1 Tax=Sphingomonas bacterium TaxID=1895847 RepID=UPI00261F9E2F|nr:alpha-ketoglutarate-dependent dioxygenase AlkB [Sphingomonas bacterium]MDB5711626.1 putative alkylated repair protein [Sphingomonas bacterium]
MRDLFSIDRKFEPIAMPDADVSLLHGLEMPMPYENMLRKLIEDIKWRQEAVRIYGKVMQQPRLIAWYGDAGKKYDYSGISLTPLPWLDILREIKRRVEDCTDARFNSVFLNLYRDHNDSMGFHSDDERELGLEPTIASVTFGATRTFVMKHKKRDDLASFKIPLEAGSVLLMKGGTQRFWKHGILKQTKPCGPRVNLTFRTIFDR